MVNTRGLSNFFITLGVYLILWSIPGVYLIFHHTRGLSDFMVNTGGLSDFFIIPGVYLILWSIPGVYLIFSSHRVFIWFYGQYRGLSNFIIPGVYLILWSIPGVYLFFFLTGCLSDFIVNYLIFSSYRGLCDGTLTSFGSIPDKPPKSWKNRDKPPVFNPNYFPPWWGPTLMARGCSSRCASRRAPHMRHRLIETGKQTRNGLGWDRG